MSAAGSSHETEQAEAARIAADQKALAEAETLPPVAKQHLDPQSAWPFPSTVKADEFDAYTDPEFTPNQE